MQDNNSAGIWMLCVAIVIGKCICRHASMPHVKSEGEAHTANSKEKIGFQSGVKQMGINIITWTPASDVTPMYMNTPYNTGIGMYFK